MAKFQPGQSGNPAGRPEGSKNKNFATLTHWFELLNNELTDMPKEKRLELIERAIDKLLPKVQSIQQSPMDSLGNATAAFSLMNNIAPINPPLEPNPHINGGNGTNGSSGA